MRHMVHSFCFVGFVVSLSEKTLRVIVRLGYDTDAVGEFIHPTITGVKISITW